MILIREKPVLRYKLLPMALSFAVSNIIPQLFVSMQWILHSFIKAEEIPLLLYVSCTNRSFNNHNRFILVEEKMGYNCTNPIIFFWASSAMKMTDSLFSILALRNVTAAVTSLSFYKKSCSCQIIKPGHPRHLFPPSWLT